MDIAKAYQSVDYNPFNESDSKVYIPLTDSQKEVWYSSLFSNDANCAYNECIGLHLFGDLDVTRFNNAFQKIVNRHDSLRSVFDVDGKMMHLLDNITYKIDLIDISKFDEDKHEVHIKNYINELVLTPFDLSQCPLFKVCLIKCSATHYFFIINIHHIVCDGWSLGIIIKELSEFYNGVEANKPAIQFFQFAHENVVYQHSQEYQKTEMFWLNQFNSEVPVLNLPVDKARPPIRTFKGNRYDVLLPDKLTESIKKIASSNGMSFVNVLLSTFEVFIYRISGNEKLIIGLPAAAQPVYGYNDLIGHCVNLLPIYTEISGAQRFSDYLKIRKKYLLNAFENQNFTFSNLLKKLKIDRDPARVPLIPVVFNVDMDIDQGVSFNGIRYKLVSNPRKCENFELYLNITGSENDMTLEFSYNIDLFDEDCIIRLAQEFIELIRSITINIDEKIDFLNIMPLWEKEIILNEWSGVKQIYQVKTNVIQCFKDIVTRFCSKTAICWQEGEMSFSELDIASNKLANYLQTLGVKPKSKIAVIMSSKKELMVSFLAVLKAGCCYIPIDPAFPDDRIKYILDESDVNILIKDSGWQNELLKEISYLEVNIDNLSIINGVSDKDLNIDITPNDPAYIIYTSGSTGEPKGVCIPHRAIIRLCKDNDFIDFTNELTFLQLSNICFDASIFEIWGSLLNGCKLVLKNSDKVTLTDITDLIEQNQVNIIWLTSGLFSLMVEKNAYRLKSLRYLMAGGDVLSTMHVLKAMAILGPGKIINGYGPTENTTFTTTYNVTDASFLSSRVPIGKPIRGTSVYILDKNRRPVTIGVEGYLYTGGEGLALYYVNKKELTDLKFIDNPFSIDKKDKLYNTGDIARWKNDGNIEFIGRDDNQLKVRGFRVEIAEIEQIILGFSGISECAVIGHGDSALTKKIIAFVVFNNSETTIDELRQYLEKSLPDYMMPSYIHQLEKLPLNEQGKVNKRQLASQTESGDQLQPEFTAPISEIEKFLVEAWKRALGVTEISTTVNFFKSGGHSLAAVQILSEIEVEYNIRLPLSVFFENTTIHDFAKILVSHAKNINWQSLTPINTKGNKIPLFIVHGGGLNVLLFNTMAHKMSPDQPIYALQAKGLDGKAAPLTSIEEMASYYISEIVKVAPKGPFALAGYSLGGYIAFEMAMQLKKMNFNVPFLAMFDTDAFIQKRYHQLDGKSEIDKLVFKIKFEFSRFIFLFLLFLKNPLKFYHEKKRVLLVRLNYLKWIKKKEKLDEETNKEYLHAEVEQAGIHALANYFLKPFEIDLDLFKAKEKRFFIQDFLYYGWKKFISGKIYLHEIPGEHANLFGSPGDVVIAEILQKRLNEVNSIHNMNENIQDK